MTLFQALQHFVIEALRNMSRSLKVSMLAVTVTAVSLFLGGSLYLLGSNLTKALASWEAEARLVVYLTPGAPEEARDEVERRIRDFGEVERFQLVSPEDAEEKLIRRLPELADLLDGLEEEPLPASFELEIRSGRSNNATVAQWKASLEAHPHVAGIDDDRLWIDQVAFAATLLRVGAAFVGGLLLAGSVFIIASVIRLAALLHREEIRVLRLVGATEFFVRGPFVVEGLVQGFVGALTALGGIWLFYAMLVRRGLPELLQDLLLSSFLTPVQMGLVVVIGTGAGLIGGLLSVRRTAAGLW